MGKYIRILNLLKQHDVKCPSCTTPEDYKAWRKLPPQAGQAGFCEDCTPKFKLKMIDQGKCDHPDIRFTRDVDGILTGRIKQLDKGKTIDSLFLDLFYR